MSLTVLVAGATGRFRPVAEVLIERGHRVRAGTRDPSSEIASELAALGAEPIVCDFDDVTTLDEAARGVDAVFASGTAHKVGPDGEVRHGRNLADALAAIGVGHLVYVSGAGSDRPTGVPIFEGKRRIEADINARRLPATILAPVYLMENVFNAWNVPTLAAGVYPSPVPADRAIQQTPIVDIAAFAVDAVEHRDDFIGQRIELASDSVNGREAARIISSISGRDLATREIDPPAGLQALFSWINRIGFDVDIAALRRDFPDVAWHSFDTWAAEQDWTSLNPPERATELTGCATGVERND